MAKPLVVLVVGMAGTGKTTLVQRIQHFVVERKISSYFINLDPAVLDVPFAANIDIRDTVNYKEVMKQYRLGPNGAIITSLNLFATKINQVISILEGKSDLGYIFVDTPGQIEVFTWSASGQLITEAFAASFPTCVMFVGDTTRCSNPQTFMSTMLYSCSIMFKSQVPLFVALNKCDITSGEQVKTWMADNDALCDVTRDSSAYAATLTQSLSLFVQEFYSDLHCTCVSAATGQGMEDLFEGMQHAREEYTTNFLPLLKQRDEQQASAREKQLRQLKNDVAAEETDH